MAEILKIVNLNKKFGNLEVLKDVNLSLNEGEILSVLGDSGCGKSTLLRIIAGLETPSGGQICVKEGCGTAMMFQSYALFPHLSVCKNVEFALWRLPSAERAQRSAQLLEKFKISELKDKTPDQISGGQAQRTAFARAVANREKLLLLDEPFANLDRNLKSALRGELKQMIKANGISAVMVTHDKEDAFLLSDKIALIKGGKVLAFGAPRELYFHPASYEIACFLGDMNLINPQDAQNLPAEFKAWLEQRNFMFRPELIISGEKYEANVVEAKFLGAFYELNLDFCGVKFKAVVSSNSQICDKFKFDLA
ncbi:ABC transporter ATP-binding protein [Campylobacter rectus]|uniref:ABC transporter ATP-binding protein n=1 Tax=Campylobacter rectus TaxID=203 RepID=UPI000F5DD102|nr:ABC transporter ATP-binding protein [Campylobacter rectus]RRD54193.1 ABC transporter ATP-binding protein [Campylobacter rectus]